MHIPDGFLTPPVFTTCFALSGGAIAWAASRTRVLDPREIPRVGVLASLVFAVQVLSFPVPFGTSVHLSGTTLFVAVAGLPMTVLATSIVLALQALLFQHGGLTTLGANTFNLAVVSPWVASVVLRVVRHQVAGPFLAASISIPASAAMCAIELHLSGRLPLWEGLVAIAVVYAVVAIGEGVATVFGLMAIGRMRKARTFHTSMS